MFEHVLVAIASNPGKTPMFTLEERVHQARRVLADIPNAEVAGYEGLTVDFALMTRHLSRDLETVFLTPQEQFTFISSTLIREIAIYGGNVAEFVDPLVAAELRKKKRTP